VLEKSLSFNIHTGVYGVKNATAAVYKKNYAQELACVWQILSEKHTVATKLVEFKFF